jgi:hypothetical protein
MSQKTDPTTHGRAGVPTSDQRWMYRELRERMERRQRQDLIERLVERRRERRLRLFRRPSR